MKNRIKILVASGFIAIVVIIMGIYIGKSNINKRDLASNDNSNVTDLELKADDDTTKTTSETSRKTDDTTKEETTEKNSLEVTSEESETTTPQQESTTPPVISNPHSAEIDPNKPMVAITFDDGPASNKTRTILDTLESYKAHATFFIVGSKIPRDEEVLKRAASIGCEIGNHSNSHAKLTSLDAQGVENELKPVNDIIKELTGQQVVVCRPPYGAVDDETAKAINAPIVLWSIDTLDWKTKDANATVNNIKNSVSDGDIILMHDIHEQSVAAAVEIIPWLIDQGYQLVTVSELGYFRRGGLINGEKYGSLK